MRRSIHRRILQQAANFHQSFTERIATSPPRGKTGVGMRGRSPQTVNRTSFSEDTVASRQKMLSQEGVLREFSVSTGEHYIFSTSLPFPMVKIANAATQIFVVTRARSSHDLGIN